jgi:hypothetical protein
MCGELFQTKQAKYKHSLKRNCAASTSLVVSSNSGTIQVNNVEDNSVTNTVTNNVNMNLDGEAVAQAINSYFQTNLAKVIEDLLKNPAFLQMAFRNEQLHEAIVQKTHYGDVQENCNVLSVDKNGKFMYVRERGKRLAIDKNDGLFQSLKNATTIANSPQIQPLLTKLPELPVKPFASAAEQKRVIKDHFISHYNKGLFNRRFAIPDYPPPIITIGEWEAVLYEILPNVVGVYRQPLDIYKELVLMSCTGFVFIEGVWFAPYGDSGWIVCDDKLVVVRKIHVHLNDLKTRAKCNMLNRFHETSRPELRHYANIMSHFPDKDLAGKAVDWILESTQ